MTVVPDDSILYVTARGMFAAEARRLRAEAGLSLTRVAESARCDKGYLSRIERGEKFPKEAVVLALDEALGARGLLSKLWYLAVSGSIVDYARRFMELEARATKMHKFMPATVPGLLQSEAYARELLRSGHPRAPQRIVDELVVARMARQQVLSREDPPLLWAVLDEAVIRRAVGGPGVMAEQLEKVVAAAGQPDVVVQVLPFAAGASGLSGESLTLLSFAHGQDVAYLEGNRIGNLVELTQAVADYSFRYDLVRAKALTPEASIDLIRQAAEDYRACAPTPDST
ncbi:helix-turn-helix domain-containing protein [Streptomyces sp. NPDC050085]|uniref:helix-turn-helix domain-containing protein n=1 Tax=Streptomyces sp. NPDC050085 TaxID=3365600 RepID=UPI00379EF1E1